MDLVSWIVYNYETEDWPIHRKELLQSTADQHYDVNQKFEKMLEDAAVNSAGGGAIAGIGVGPQGEPGVSQAAQRRIQKKNRVMARL